MPAQRLARDSTADRGLPGLHPRGPRQFPIAAIVLTNGDLDHTFGLLSLRESQPLAVYATASVRRGFTGGNVLYRTLQRFPGQVSWRTLKLGREVELAGPDGRPTGPDRGPCRRRESCRSISKASRRPIPVTMWASASAGGFRAPARLLPGGRRTHPGRAGALDAAACLFFDGTFWSSDELPARSWRKAREDMAHLPVGGRVGAWPPCADSAPPADSTSTSTTRTHSCATIPPSAAPSRQPAGKWPATAWR